MKRFLSLVLVAAFAAMLTGLTADNAMAQSGRSPQGKSASHSYGPFDDDGDGIPNGQDPDYVKPKDGTGHQFGKLNGAAKASGKAFARGTARRNGTCTGTGVCDGTGPKGRGR